MYFLRLIIALLACLSLSDSTHSQEPGWYKRFVANIGTYPITLHLHKSGTGYSGFYYYQKTQQPIYFSGEDSSAGRDTLKLMVFQSGEEQANEVFRIVFHGDNLAGDWRKTPESKPLPLQGSAKPIPGLSFTLYTSSGSVEMRPGKPETPEASIHASTVWPLEKNPTANVIRNYIRKSFADKESQADIAEILKQNQQDFLKGYQEENKDLHDSDWVQFPSAYMLSEDHTLMVVYHSPNLLTLANFYYAYTGGAHGNYGTGYESFDLLTNKKIALKDILNTEGIKKLNSLLEKSFRKQYHLKDSEPLTEGGLFDDKIVANDNFFLTGKGIGFNYTPYEIGPYVMGEITLFIPFTELNDYLQPGIRKVIAN